MSKLSDRILARRLAKKGSGSSSALGPIYVKPSEVSRLNEEARLNAVVVSGTVNNPVYRDVSGRTVTSSGGSSSRVNQAQIDLQRTQELQRQEENRRMEELRRLEEQNKRFQAEKLRREIEKKRTIENKKLEEKALRLREEKKRLEVREVTNIQEELRREKERQRNIVTTYIPETDQFGRSESYYVQVKAEKELRDYANSVQNALQSAVNSGATTLEKANNTLEKAINEKASLIQARIEKEFEKKYGDSTDYKINKKKIMNLKNLNKKNVIAKLENKLVKSKSYKTRQKIEKIATFPERKIELALNKIRKIPGTQLVYTRGLSPKLMTEGEAKLRKQKYVTLPINTADVINVGSFFVPVVGQARAITYTAGVSGKITGGGVGYILKNPLEVISAGLIAGSSVIKALKSARALRGTSISIAGTTRKVGAFQITKLKFSNLLKIRGSSGSATVVSGGRGKTSFSITFGTIRKGGKVEGIVGFEGSLNRNLKLLLKKFITLENKNGQLDVLKVIRQLENWKRTSSTSRGVFATITQRKVFEFPSTQLRRYINIDMQDFKSVANAFTKGEWNMIAGTTITNSGTKSIFLGIIKSIINNQKTFKLSGSGGVLTQLQQTNKLTVTQLKQIQQTLKKTTGVISSAMAKVKPYSNNKITQRVMATTVIKKALNSSKNITTAKQKIENKNFVSTTLKVETRQISSTQQSSRLSVQSRSKFKQQEKVLTSQLMKLEQRVKQAQRQKGRLSFAQKQRIIQRYKRPILNLQTKLRVIRANLRTPKIRRPTKFTPIIIRRKKKETRKPLLKKQFLGYNVFVRSRGKILKANKKPLSKIDAENRLAYVLDHTTAVTGYTKEIGRYKKLGGITSRESNARNIIKARTYQVVRGKKRQLRRTIIERKGKPRINTRGEVRGLTASRLIASLNSKRRKVVRRKVIKRKIVRRRVKRRGLKRRR